MATQELSIRELHPHKYKVHTLVYSELHDDMVSAIIREKQIKK